MRLLLRRNLRSQISPRRRPWRKRRGASARPNERRRNGCGRRRGVLSDCHTTTITMTMTMAAVIMGAGDTGTDPVLVHPRDELLVSATEDRCSAILAAIGRRSDRTARIEIEMLTTVSVRGDRNGKAIGGGGTAAESCLAEAEVSGSLRLAGGDKPARIIYHHVSSTYI
jgi:hypothetical protein